MKQSWNEDGETHFHYDDEDDADNDDDDDGDDDHANDDEAFGERALEQHPNRGSARAALREIRKGHYKMPPIKRCHRRRSQCTSRNANADRCSRVSLQVLS